MLNLADLVELLEDVGGLHGGELLEKGCELYRDLYLTKGRFGVEKTHDGQVLLFHEDRFEHVFRRRVTSCAPRSGKMRLTRSASLASAGLDRLSQDKSSAPRASKCRVQQVDRARPIGYTLLNRSSTWFGRSRGHPAAGSSHRHIPRREKPSSGTNAAEGR